MESRMQQLPQPFGRMYSQVLDALSNEDPARADAIARESVRLAEIRGERPELMYALHLTLGRAFLDYEMFPSAIRHLAETAKRGGTYVYPLAICLARSGDIDGGFSRLLNEIDHMPSFMPVLIPPILVMLSQVQPSEAVFERIYILMNRIQMGEYLTLRGAIEPSDEDSVIPLGTRWVPSRMIQSLVVRFPESTETLDPSAIQFISREELEAEEYEEPAEAPIEREASDMLFEDGSVGAD
jgi:hypothetical protein